MGSSHLAPDTPELRSSLLDLGLVDVSDLLTGIEPSRLSILNTIDLDESRM